MREVPYGGGGSFEGGSYGRGGSYEGGTPVLALLREGIFVAAAEIRLLGLEEIHLPGLEFACLPGRRKTLSPISPNPAKGGEAIPKLTIFPDNNLLLPGKFCFL